MAIEGHGAPCPEPPCGGGVYYGCTTSVDCYEMYDGKFWWFLAAGAKKRFESIPNATYIAEKNWDHMMATWGVDYCLNTDKVDKPEDMHVV